MVVQPRFEILASAESSHQQSKGPRDGGKPVGRTGAANSELKLATQKKSAKTSETTNHTSFASDIE
jgi:hypothetical protein